MLTVHFLNAGVVNKGGLQIYLPEEDFQKDIGSVLMDAIINHPLKLV